MAKIKKLNDKGELIYPATILEAVKDPSTKENLREIINKGTTEYNVSVQHPTGGIGGTNKYTLETAIQKIPVAYRNVGIKCSFLNESGKLEMWKYLEIFTNWIDYANWENIENNSRTGNTENTDLNIADESGNVIVKFSEGHIRTKQFNSQNVVKEMNVVDNVLKIGI